MLIFFSSFLETELGERDQDVVKLRLRLTNIRETGL